LDFYFGSYVKSKNFGVCIFSIPDLGILQKSVILDKDEILLEFSSLLLVFDFILMNPLFFRDIKVFSIYGSNPKIFYYIKSDRGIPKKAEPFKRAFEAFTENIVSKMNVYFDFLLSPISKSKKFMDVVSMKTDRNLAVRLTALSKEHLNDKLKNSQQEF
jgi:hypothetical protein